MGGCGSAMRRLESAALRHLAHKAWRAFDARLLEWRTPAIHGGLLMLLMLSVALPAQRWLSAQRAAHRAALELRASVSALPERPTPTGAGGAQADAPPLIALVNRTAPALGLAFGDFRPEGDARLRLDLRAGDFDAVLRWLDQLGQEHGVGILALDVRATDTPGRIDAAVTIGRYTQRREGKP